MTLLEFLQEQGIEHRQAGEDKHAREGWVQVQCPRCGPGSGAFHLGLGLTSWGANCWRCGPQRMGEALAELSGKSVGSVLGMLKGAEIAPRAGKARVNRAAKCVLPPGRGPLLAAHRNYLASRGFSFRDVERLWGLQGIGQAGDLSWRIFIPIRVGTETVSWTARAVGSSKQRYISASAEQEAIPHKHLLYGEEFARHAVLAVEGPTDVWRMGPGAVGTFGTAITRAQVLRLSKYPRVGICFDPEPAAQRRAEKLRDELSLFTKVSNIVLDGHDPGDATEKEVAQVRKIIGL